MSPEQKASLTTAFEALGPERVTRGLRATGHSSNDCFLALAIYGERGALARQLDRRWRRDHFVSTLFGVRVQVVSEVVEAWDHDAGTFRALAAEWLELNRAAYRPGRWSARDQRRTGQSWARAGAPGAADAGRWAALAADVSAANCLKSLKSANGSGRAKTAVPIAGFCLSAVLVNCDGRLDT